MISNSFFLKSRTQVGYSSISTSSFVSHRQFSPSKVHAHFPPSKQLISFVSKSYGSHFNLKTCPRKLDNHDSNEMHSKQPFSMAREGKLRVKGLSYFCPLTIYNVPRKKQFSSCFQCLNVSIQMQCLWLQVVGFQNQRPSDWRSNSQTPSLVIVILLSRVALCKFTFHSIDKVFTM